VRRWLGKLGNVERERGRRGARDLKNILPHKRRDFLHLKPAAIYTADGHTFDAEVLNPLSGLPFRPEITTVLDVGTRRCMGWSVGLAESRFTVLEALSHASRAAIGALWYVDWGRGFENLMMTDEATGLMGRLGMTMTHSRAYNSQAKGASERSHNIFTRAAANLPSFVGKNMDDEARQKLFKLSRKEVRLHGKILNSPIPTWDEFKGYIERVVDEYNDRPHRSLPKFTDRDGKRRHMSPNEFWALKVAEFGEPPSVSPEEEGYLFRPQVMRTVRRGEVSLFSNTYYSAELMEFNGETVRVGYDVQDALWVWIYDDVGRLICKAEWHGNSTDYMPVSVLERAEDKRNSEDNVKLKWVLIGHARAFALVLLSPGNLAASPVLYFGEFPSLAVADEHQNLLGVGANGSEKYFNLSSSYSRFYCAATTDTAGYCWQGSLTVSPDDFAKINPDARPKGREAEIEVQINADTFVIIAEDYSDNRRFGQKSYTVTGRSVTARLGADYAPKGRGTYHNPIYAQQIATEVLRPTGVDLDGWTMVDWLIPGDVYSLTDKTPIAVLQELAQAAGGFVESDHARPVVRFKPKWKKASWEVSDAPADVSVPVSVIFSISGQRNVLERANGVYVWPSHNKGKGADVYRNGSNREPRASALTNTQPVLLAAGIAALSETGVHKRETVSLPVSDKYAIPMANLGEIWQINEPLGNWQGVVVGVSVEVKIENDAPVVTQNVTIDRYFDE